MPPAPATPSEKFSVGAALRFGWDQTWANLGQLVLAGLLVLVGGLILSVIEQGLGLGGFSKFDITLNGTTREFRSYSSGPLIAIFEIVVSVGIIRGTVAVADGEKFRALSVFSFSRVWPYFLSSIVVIVGAFVGLILLIIPGIVFLFLTYYYGYFIVARNEGPIQALKSSMAGVKANASTVFLFALACFGVAILGLLCLFVGLLVAIPVITFATGYTFRHLVEPAATS